MSIADKLFNEGYNNAAFRYKENADRFIALWKRKGWTCAIVRSDGPVMDLPGEPYTHNAYACSCQEKVPQFTRAEERMFNQAEKAIRMSEKQPRKYWQYQLRRGVLKRIDPEIRPLIQELNEKGLYTVESCAGHRGGLDQRGRIFFSKRNPDCTKIRRILIAYGLTGLKKDKQLSDSQKVVYEFDPIGKPRSG